MSIRDFFPYITITENSTSDSFTIKPKEITWNNLLTDITDSRKIKCIINGKKIYEGDVR